MQTKKRSLILLILALVNFTNIVDSMLIMPLGDIFIDLFNLTAGEYSYLVSAYAIAASISALTGFFLIDRFDRKKVLLFIYTGFGIGTILCAFANSYILLVSVRLFTGLFGGMIAATILSIVSDLYPFKERGAAMGILFASFSAASALGIPIGLYLADQGSWQLPFEILGSIALLISVVLFFIFPNMTSHVAKERKSMLSTIRSITRDQNQINALVAGFVLILAHFIIIPFISPYLIKNVGLTQSEITYQFLFGGLATVVSSPIIGRMTDKYGVMKVFIAMIVLSFIPTIILTNLSVVPVTLAIFYTTLFFIFGSGRMISPNTIITAAAPQENRGSFMSIKSSLQQLAIAVSSFLGGAIVYLGEGDIYYNYEYVGYLSILFSFFAIYLVGRIKVAKGN
jgi:DHA1 family inner membrane transport protein